MNARVQLAAVIVGTLAVGCGIGSSGPVIARVERIQITPGRLALQPFQAVPLNIAVITSRGIDSTGAAAALQFSASGGTIAGNGILNGVFYITYTSPAQPGTYTLTVTTASGAPTATAEIAVTSNPVPVNSVTVTPGTVSRALNDTTRLHATLSDESGAAIFGRAITWSTSDGNVAMVFAEGFVRAMGVGSATITATSEGKSGTAVVTVHQ